MFFILGDISEFDAIVYHTFDLKQIKHLLPDQK